ncbi:MAG: hypothetical protein IPL01_23005 [Acidobacteria bacterium]|nr:hypothetical protein [Acidobacteriota bacterium]
MTHRGATTAGSGQITDNYDAAYTTQYYYDDYNRLTGAYAGPIPNWTWSRSYAHDPWGNITNLAGVTQNYATNTSGAPATNRVIGDSTGAAFGYDQAGNMTSAPGWSYACDGANRLIRLQDLPAQAPMLLTATG